MCGTPKPVPKILKEIHLAFFCGFEAFPSTEIFHFVVIGTQMAIITV